MSIDNPNVQGYSFEFKKLNYSTVYDFDNPILLEEVNQIVIEGEYDFMVYEYESDIEGVLDIFTSVPLDIYYFDINGEIRYSPYNYSKYPRMSNYVPIKVGKNYIIITEQEAVNASIEVEFVTFTKFSAEVSDMMVLTEEYTSEYYVFGNSIYFRIDVINPGTYTIDYLLEFGSTVNTIEYYSVANEKSYYGKSTYLMEGTYYIRIPTSQPLARIKVKYSFTEGYTYGYNSPTNVVNDYEVINIFLEKDEEFDIPVNEIFKNSKIEIFSFSINKIGLSFITVEGSKIKGVNNGINSIYITLFEAFTRRVYNVKIANVYVEDSESAIEIRTFKDLIEINNNLSGNYILKANIDLSGIDWIPIGMVSNIPFTGVFINPEGYIISNLKCSGSRCGLFNGIENAYISGLKLKDININATLDEHGNSYAGGIALNIFMSTIYNSSVTGTINTYTRAGGIVGSNSWGQIINCSFEGNITVSGSGYAIAGGIVGSSSTNDKNPGIAGNVVKANIVSGDYAGGISGRGAYYGGFSNNSFEGTLVGLTTNEQVNK